MTQYQAYEPGVEVNGETVLSVIKGVKVFKSQAIRILEKNGIEAPEPGLWYSQQAWLNAFQEIARTVGERSLFSIGMSIPRNAKFPDGIDTIEKALLAIDKAYHMNHRGGEIGCYQAKKIEDRAIKMLCRNPYPCEFDKGIITAMAERFKPNESNGVRLLHPPAARCRKKGDEGCIYVITW